MGVIFPLQETGAPLAMVPSGQRVAALKVVLVRLALAMCWAPSRVGVRMEAPQR